MRGPGPILRDPGQLEQGGEAGNNEPAEKGRPGRGGREGRDARVGEEVGDR